MKLESMKDLLVSELQDVQGAERQLAQTLPKIIREVTHLALRKELEGFLGETTQHEQRVEGCFQKLGVSAPPSRSHGMIGLVSGWLEIQAAQAQRDVLDAAIISSVQHMVHYQIAGYGCARAFAQVLGQTEVVKALGETLGEIERTDRRLSELAKSLVNKEAELHSHPQA